jgi:CPSF A subunit region
MQEDPYAMRIFGKGANRLEIAAAEYLPDGGDLYILAIDAQGTLHTYKFDPSSASLKPVLCFVIFPTATNALQILSR